jgi:hypothetical protein
LTIYTSTSACASGAVSGARGNERKSIRTTPMAFRKGIVPLSSLNTTQASLALAGLLFVGLLGFRCRKQGTLAGVFFLTLVGLAVWGCSGSGSSSSTPIAPKGTYTLTIVGTDTSSSSITASTTMTLTID